MARVYDPQKHCGAKNRQHKPCTNPKGFKTAHPGEGRCHRHGGLQPNDRRLKTGLRSSLYKQVAPKDLAASIQAAEAAPLLDLSSEVNLLKGLLHNFIKRHESGKAEAEVFVEQYGSLINTIIKNDDPAVIATAIAKLKERGKGVARAGFDMDSAAKLIEAIRRTVQTIHELQQRTTISVAECAAWAERVALCIRKRVVDRKTLELLLKDLDKVQPPRGWPSYSEPLADPD